MKTIEEFRAWARPRCKEVIHMGDDMPCLVWQGATTNKGKHPRASIGGKVVAVRRFMFPLAHPNSSDLGQDTFRPECGCDLCIEPTHHKRVPPSVFRSVPKSFAGRLNMQKAARASRSKLRNPEVIVPIVLADPRPATKLSKELGISEYVIHDIRRGKWSVANNVFGQLIAHANGGLR